MVDNGGHQSTFPQARASLVVALWLRSFSVRTTGLWKTKHAQKVSREAMIVGVEFMHHSSRVQGRILLLPDRRFESVKIGLGRGL
jgi:hypothetical protein